MQQDRRPPADGEPDDDEQPAEQRLGDGRARNDGSSRPRRPRRLEAVAEHDHDRGREQRGGHGHHRRAGEAGDEQHGQARRPGPRRAATARTASRRARRPGRRATSDAWFASTPYQGASRSSRRSNVPSAATHMPATGPPRVIAAAMNGRWKAERHVAAGVAQDPHPAGQARTASTPRRPPRRPHGSGEPGDRDRRGEQGAAGRQGRERGEDDRPEPEDDRRGGVPGEQRRAPRDTEREPGIGRPAGKGQAHARAACPAEVRIWGVPPALTPGRNQRPGNARSVCPEGSGERVARSPTRWS